MSQLPPRKSEGSSPNLVRDDQGAVMVLGIFMCATLVGALWYIAGIGDAIVFRERLQEAADAGAMSVAALNARGMNLLVFINLIMACVLAIRVALKTLEVTLIAAETAFAGCALVPVVLGNVLEPVCAALVAPTGEAIETVEDIIQDTRDPINNALKGLHNAQKGIMRVVPGGSLAGSLQVLDKYRPFIVETPLPSFATPSITRITDGLPVQDGSTDKLCGKAGKAMGALMDSLIPIDLGPANGIFSGIMESVASAGSSYFCELGGSGKAPDFSDLMNKTANDKCDKEIEKRQKDLNKRNGDWQAECAPRGITCEDKVPKDPFDPSAGTKSEMSGPNYDALTKSTKPEDKAALTKLSDLEQKRDLAQDDLDSFDRPKCVQDTKKALKAKMDKIPPSPAGNGNGMEPMKVLDGWKNGSPEGQAISYVNAEESLLKRSPHGVKVGAQKDKRASAKIEVPTASSFAYAQAEYFYDCTGAWSTDSCNKDEEAMWHFRWRARLRRYNNPWETKPPIDAALTADIVFRAGEMGLAAAKQGVSLNVVFRGKLETLLVNPTQLKLH
jgi:hypothetical protein